MTTMNPYANRLAQYEDTAVQTSSPEKLVVLLYEGAIRFLRQAASATQSRNIEQKRQSVDRALAVIQNPQPALERERELLEDFICLSEEQLLLLDDENIDAVNTLLQRRADLMIELTAIEATLGTWITQIRTDPSVTADMMRQLRAVNDEIVSMANHIVEIDEQTHARLDEIKERTRRELQEIDREGKMLHLYAEAYQKPTTRFHLKG